MIIVPYYVVSRLVGEGVAVENVYWFSCLGPNTEIVRGSYQKCDSITWDDQYSTESPLTELTRLLILFYYKELCLQRVRGRNAKRKASPTHQPIQNTHFWVPPVHEGEQCRQQSSIQVMKAPDWVSSLGCRILLAYRILLTPFLPQCPKPPCLLKGHFS